MEKGPIVMYEVLYWRNIMQIQNMLKTWEEKQAAENQWKSD